MMLAIVVAVCGVLGSAVTTPAVAEPGPSGRYQVDPARGDDATGTGSAERPFRTINRALAAAQSGESVFLRPGTYFEDVQTVQPGVTVVGPPTAVLHGAGGDRMFQVHHDDTTLRGFTIDGKVCADLVVACYRGKAIYVVSTVAHDGVSGTKILGMRLTNLGDECVRIKYFATRSLVEGNEIGPCGIHDFTIPNTGTGQNGEGFYLGTAPEQLDRNPSPEPDATNDNRVANNTIDTQAAECVDVKEAARDNIVEHNTCTGQHPRNGNSGAMESRGPSNTFRFNRIHHNAAAGIRLGGDLPGDAVDNDVHHNVITHNARGGIKVQDFGPHGKICGNVMFANEGGNAVGDYLDQIGDPTALCLPL
jgi:parallel beta helix pectate lyase-like protein/uncharacterized protein DUF1565